MGLERKVEAFLGEFRIIVPALGALLGFQLTVAFQGGFTELPGLARSANFAGVCCTCVALLLLITPAGYHRFTKEVAYTEDFLMFAQKAISLALLFVALSLGLSLYVQGVRTFNSQLGGVAPASGLVVALLVAWWLLPWRRARAMDPGAKEPLAHKRRAS